MAFIHQHVRHNSFPINQSIDLGVIMAKSTTIDDLNAVNERIRAFSFESEQLGSAKPGLFFVYFQSFQSHIIEFYNNKI